MNKTDLRCLIPVIFLWINQADAICRLHICFTWKISIETLTLVCKIEHIDHIVSVLNNKHEEIADCHPTGISRFSCSPHVANVSVSITENIVTALFTGSIDERVNGIWTCRHGSSLTNASVEVTVLYKKEQKSNVGLSSTIIPNNRIEEKRPLHWYTVLSSFIGFLFGLVCTFFVTREYIKDKMSNCQSKCLHFVNNASGRRIIIIKVLVTIVLMILMLTISIMFQINEQTIHKNELLVIFVGLLGLVFGVACVIIWIKLKGTTPERQNNQNESATIDPMIQQMIDNSHLRAT